MANNLIERKWDEVKPMCVSDNATPEAEANAKRIFLLGAALATTTIEERTKDSDKKLRNAFIENFAKTIVEALHNVNQEKGEG